MMQGPDRIPDLPARLLGPLVGSVAGPYGILAGFVMGVVADRFAQEWRRIVRARAFLVHPLSSENPGIPDSAAALIGLSAQVSVSGPPRFLPARKAALVTRLQQLLPGSDGSSEAPQPFLARVTEEAFSRPDRIDADGLLERCRIACGKEEKLLLIDCLTAVAATPAADADPAALRKVRGAAERLGIGPGEAGEIIRRYRTEDDEPYRLLGLEPGAPHAEVKRVYRRLAAAFHPDTAAGLEEEQLLAMSEAFRRISEAYRSLTGTSGRTRPPGADR